MGNKKKPDGKSLSTEDVIEIIAERRSFTKSDVREILAELKSIFEECIVNDMEIDLHGFLHMQVVNMNYKKPPGIVKHRGLDTFNSRTKRISYRVPLNYKKLIREKALKENIE